MSEEHFPLLNDASAMLSRIAADHASAPRAITQLAYAAHALGGVEVKQLARHRTALRRIAKYIKLAIEIGDGHANDHRAAKQAERTAALEAAE